jgi:hypothetical protein
MKLGLRGLALLMVLACWTQAAVSILHQPHASPVAERRTGGDPERSHDPATCGLCQALSQVRAQSCVAPLGTIALPPAVVLDVADHVVTAVTPLAPLSQESRAPPSTAIA